MKTLTFLPGWFQSFTVLVNERLLLLRDGAPLEWVGPGQYSRWLSGRGLTGLVFDLDQVYQTLGPALRAVSVPEGAERIEVGAEELGLLWVEGAPFAVLPPGQHLLWTTRRSTRLEKVSSLPLRARIPVGFSELLSAELAAKSVVLRIAAHRRVLAFQPGEAPQWLAPGPAILMLRDAVSEIHTFDLNGAPAQAGPELEAALNPEDGEVLEVPPAHLALVRADGRPARVLQPGRYVLWRSRERLSVELVDTSPLEAKLPADFSKLIPADSALQVVVPEHEVSVLSVDGRWDRVLGAGHHVFFTTDRKLGLSPVDLREAEHALSGQEVMTADKVTLRLNLVVRYRVVDPLRLLRSVARLADAIHTETQLVARAHVAAHSLDQLLEQRNLAAEAMKVALAERAAAWGVEVRVADIKDLVLPPEIKAILSKVITAEKEAAANLVLRREEAAATRSLANTARMLENNPTLARLKELELLREVAGKVGQVQLVIGGEALTEKLRLLPAAP